MNRRGFTFIEMIIVIVLLAIVGTIGATLLHEGLRTMSAGKIMVERTRQVAHALSLIESEIAEARSNSAADLQISGNSLQFRDTEGSLIAYALDGNGYLTRNGINLADHITSLSFSYFNAANALIADPLTADTTTVRCIKVALTSVKEGETINLTALICPRSFL